MLFERDVPLELLEYARYCLGSSCRTFKNERHSLYRAKGFRFYSELK